MENSPKKFYKRLMIFAIVIGVLFGADGIRVAYLQTVKKDELSAKAESQQLSDDEIPAIRGTIYDANGNVLAQSATVYNVYLDPYYIKDDEQRTLIVDNLAKILRYDDEQKAELNEKAHKTNHYAMVEKKIEYSVKKEITQFIDENKIKGVIRFETTAKRYYPYNSFASSVIGFTGADHQGLSGLESYYDEELTGVNGRVITGQDSNGHELPIDYETSIDPINGNSLVLTLNQTIQYYLEKGLRSTLEEYKCKGAYGVVMNCKTGAVLGMASLPDFDCNDPHTITYQKTKDELKKIKNEEERSEALSLAVQNQWRNFTVNDTYLPGSVFKTFMASIALEENIVDLNTTYNCTGAIRVPPYTMKCHYHPGHGVQTLTQGLENSCNPFFITIGQKMGKEIYFKYFQSFGFTEKTGIDLPGEADSQYKPLEEYGIVELSSASFGQTNSLTPIQVCTGLCAIANGGVLLKPYIVSQIKDENGNIVKKTERTEVRRVISEETSEKVRGMMKAVVDNGTGKNGYVAGYRVGGKTGTSTKLGEFKEGEKTKYIVSFAAIAPSDDPEIAMIIIIDEPNQDLGGGALCAPIASEIISQAMVELNIEPRYNEKELKEISIKTPNVTGKKISDAKATLESVGIKYKVVGNGDKVVKQNPSSASNVPAGGTVVLYTEKGMKNTTKVPSFIGMTVGEANRAAAENNINIEITGNKLSSSSVIAYRQSVDEGKEVEIGSVVSVSFKNTKAVLD